MHKTLPPRAPLNWGRRKKAAEFIAWADRGPRPDSHPVPDGILTLADLRALSAPDAEAPLREAIAGRVASFRGTRQRTGLTHSEERVLEAYESLLALSAHPAPEPSAAWLTEALEHLRIVCVGKASPISAVGKAKQFLAQMSERGL